MKRNAFHIVAWNRFTYLVEYNAGSDVGTDDVELLERLLGNGQGCEDSDGVNDNDLMVVVDGWGDC